MTSAGPVGNSSPLMHHFLKSSFPILSGKPGLSFDLNLKRILVERKSWVWRLFLGSYCNVPSISYQFSILMSPEDFRVPRMELFSTHCRHYDSACQSRHEEAQTSRSQGTEAGCWWYDYVSLHLIHCLPDTTHLSCPSMSFLSLQFSGSPNVLWGCLHAKPLQLYLTLLSHGL